MPAIRHRHNDRVTTLNGQGYVSSKGITGDRVGALLKSGEAEYYRFAGFLPYDFDTKQLQLVKVIDIIAFTLDDDGLIGWEDLKRDDYCVGCYSNGSIFLLIENDKPITHPLPPKRKRLGEVVSIFKDR
ncbi:hypothetical protein VNTUMSATTG_60970 (plasmid) [Vibrio nigripulchritudo]|uniref:hypothetical protein n=1 Tax=Vibrio nigripulchritudo TaxID=28173 RepID=UPI00190BDA95|nr:hypothetical protein [Vibrio nigripulchritudo]BCL74160.1 hypothetical protein VNTUMSATTG_60970 [Vibrio nigripulchritudo]